jgi:hypothetical protein
MTFLDLLSSSFQPIKQKSRDCMRPMFLTVLIQKVSRIKSPLIDDFWKKIFENFSPKKLKSMVFWDHPVKKMFFEIFSRFDPHTRLSFTLLLTYSTLLFRKSYCPFCIAFNKFLTISIFGRTSGSSAQQSLIKWS